MISISATTNNYVNFQGKKSSDDNETSPIRRGSSVAQKIAIPTAAMLLYLNATGVKAMDYDNNNEPMQDNIEYVESYNNMNDFKSDSANALSVWSKWNKTQLSSEELQDAPSPIITVKGKEKVAGIVVDTKSNKLYRYDEDGNAYDGYQIASGVIGRGGKSITHTGIRYIDHIETYPYKEYPGTKRSRDPKAYGPKILHLVVVDPKVGVNFDDNGKCLNPDNGEYIHGNNKASSIGHHASHGCIRMDNEVIKMMAEETPVGTYVLIK